MAETGTSGTLWVVATPIGNLDDITLRALQVLRAAHRVAAEDTRHTRRLLAHHGIRAELLALHEHNEDRAGASVLAALEAGRDIALVSDAGTPLISDPGFRVVRAARARGLRVSPVPGPCAAIAALSVAGLPPDRFVFEGFLPARGAARRARLQALAGEPRTLVFHESGHRIGAMLDDCVAAFGAARPAVLARELTKLHETVLSQSLGELARRVAGDPDQARGEIVLLVGGRPAEAGDALAEGRRVLALLSPHLPPARAAQLAAAISGAPRKTLYAGGD